MNEGNEDVGLAWDIILMFFCLVWMKFIALA